jgi:hypothetical protein
MKKIVAIFAFALVLFSCSENKSALYSGSVNSPGLLYFEKATSRLDIVMDGEGRVEIPINFSSLSSEDRTVNIEILDTSTADPLNYSMPSSVVVPANEFSAPLVIEGVDVTAETAPTLLILKISSYTGGLDNISISSTVHEVRVAQSCPIDPTKFIGEYLIEETTPFVDGPTLNHNSVIELKHLNPNSPSTERKFATQNYPNYCAPTRDFFFDLQCGEVIVRANQASTCTCSADGLFFGPAITPETFDPEDDSVFYLTFTNDVTGDCSDAVQTTYKFTKQ